MKAVLDIETIPCPDSQRSLLPPIKPPAYLKEETKIRAWQREELPRLKEEQYLATALDPTWGRLICVGLMAFSNDLNFELAFVIYGENEKKLLRGFWQKIKEFKNPYLITHNGLSFDLPFIWKRSVIHQVQPTMQFKLNRYRTDYVYDTMAVWSNWDLRNAIKLGLLAKVLGVEEKTGEGSQVYEMWKAHELKDIADYCMQDTYVTYACYCRMIFCQPVERSRINVKYLRVD